MSNVLESSFAMEIFVHGKDKSWSLGISAAKKKFDIWFQQANFGELGYLCSQLTHCCEVLKWCFHKENWFSSILHPVWGWCCLSYLKWWKFEHANFLSLVQSENPLKIHHALRWWVLYVFFSWDTFASPQDPVGRPNPQCHLGIPQKHLVHPSSTRLILGEKDKQWQHALFLFYTTLKRSPGTLDVISVNAAISCWALVSWISYFP